jgi:nucleotidyltransferase substrate binding protein (TIGR01987 family)
MADPDVRWKQRFQNFDRAYVLLRSAFEDRTLDQFNELEQEGLIQRFEFCYELAWKTMKDYLEDSGTVITPVTPRHVIKQAFSAGLIGDGQVWIDMMLHRNLLSHTYDFSKFCIVLKAVQSRYLEAFGRLHDWLLDQMLES